MFGVMPATKTPSAFEWSGTFPYPALTSAELYEYLGVDGTISPDLGEESSHLWQGEAVPSLDIGTLGINTSWDFASVNTAVTTDAGYRLGVGNVMNHDAVADVIGTGAAVNRIPSAKDGTRSFLFGGIMQVDTLPEADVNAILIHQYNNSTSDGWYLAMWNVPTQERQLRFLIVQNGFATVHQVLAVVPIEYTEPFAFVANLDVSAGLIKVFTSAPGSYAELAWSDVGDFDSGAQPMRVGESSIAGIGSHTGLWAQMFSFEYSSGIDAELSWANMEHFLKYCDGFLTV